MTSNFITFKEGVKFRLNTRNTEKYVSPGFGLVFEAPSSWTDNSNEKFFQLIEDKTNTQFTSSAYEFNNMTDIEWARSRFDVVRNGMPYLQETGNMHRINGELWTGLSSEFFGKFPGNDYKSVYLVVTFIKKNKMVSFTVTAEANAYLKNKYFYQTLISRNLDIYDVVVKKTT